VKRRLTPQTSLPVIAVAPFVNARTPLKKGPKRKLDPSLSFYQDETGNFWGLTHKDKRYTPLEVVLRDLFVDELVKAQARPVVIESQASPEAQRSAAQAAGAAYWLAAEVKAFSLVRKPPSRLLSILLHEFPRIHDVLNQGKALYAVNLHLSLYRVADGVLVWDQRLETDRAARANPLGLGPFPLMFKEILPGHLQRGSDDVVGQAERDVELAKQKAAAPPKEVAPPASAETPEETPAPAASKKKKSGKSSPSKAKP
jgi:hypothetical protein